MEFTYNPLGLDTGFEPLSSKISGWHKHSKPEHHGLPFGSREIFSNGDRFYQDTDYNTKYQSTFFPKEPVMPPPPAPIPRGPGPGGLCSPQMFLGGY